MDPTSHWKKRRALLCAFCPATCARPAIPPQATAFLTIDWLEMHKASHHQIAFGVSQFIVVASRGSKLTVWRA